MSFSSLKVQPRVISILKGALRSSHLPHAFLFSGPVDSGQRQVAFELAKAVFCENKKDFESCDTCFHCRQVDKASHPDLMIVEPAEDSRFIKIERIRELIGMANLKPFQANSKFFVIDSAEKMNEDAQNALLKTLEEPQGRAYFILITSSQDELLPTVRSRTQILGFVPDSVRTELDPDVEKLKKEVLSYALRAEDSQQRPPDLSKTDRETIAGVLDFLMEYFRELLLLRVGAGELIGASLSLGEKERRAGEYHEETLEQKIEILSEFKEKIRQNVNIKLAQSVLWDSLGKADAR